MTDVTIVDYGMGNLRSVQKAVQFLGHEACITDDPERIAQAAQIIVPGVGAFADAMLALKARGLDTLLREKAASGTPMLGICLGMQLFFDSSEEDGYHEGLGLIPGAVIQLPKTVKVPHMGWNDLTFERTCPLFEGLAEPVQVYFVHSFYIPGSNPAVIARCDYGVSIGAAVRRENVFATQFHPEKSGRIGLTMLNNIVNWGKSHAV